jgi:hypothetical protein
MARNRQDIVKEIAAHERNNDGSIQWVDDLRDLINELDEYDLNHPEEIPDDDGEDPELDPEYDLEPDVDETNYNPYTGADDLSDYYSEEGDRW